MAASTPDAFEWDVPEISQHLSTVCWLASYQMFYGWKKGKKASDVVPKLKSAGISVTKALQINQWAKAAKALGLFGWPVNHMTSQSGMAHAIENYGPIWCAGDFMPSSGHALVIRGYHRYKETMWLKMNDPWEIAYSRDREMRHKDWCRLIKNVPFACQITW